MTTSGDRPFDHGLTQGQGDQAQRLRDLVRRSGAPRAAEPRPERPAIVECKPRTLGRPDRAAPMPVNPRPRLIAVASGKGGVGKTNLGVNLAAALAKRGQRPVVVDGDLGLANADVLFGVNANVHLGHVIDGRATVAEALVEAPGGVRLLSGAPGVARLAQLPAPERDDLVHALHRLGSAADLVIIDCGAGIGEGVTGFVRAADVALIVTTPEPTAIADAYALIKCLITKPRLGYGPAVPLALVVNQARSLGEARRVHGRIDAVSQRFLDRRVPAAGWLPADPSVPAAVRARVPYVLRTPRSPAGRAVMDLADGLARTLEPGPGLPERRARPIGVRLANMFGMRRGRRRFGWSALTSGSSGWIGRPMPE